VTFAWLAVRRSPRSVGRLGRAEVLDLDRPGTLLHLRHFDTALLRLLISRRRKHPQRQTCHCESSCSAYDRPCFDYHKPLPVDSRTLLRPVARAREKEI
jgi:hypothetical protein